jgi:hypothetical protein
MIRASLKGQRLVALFALGAILLNFPLLANFNRPLVVAGLPALYLYLFVVWAGLIGAVWLLARGRWGGEE